MNKLVGLRIGIAILTVVGCGRSFAQQRNVINQSHDATVKIVSVAGNVSGSGSLVGQSLVLTCFHVVGTFQPQNGGGVPQVFSDLEVTLSSGEVIAGVVVSIPTPTDYSPLQYDFAFVKLAHPPRGSPSALKLATEQEKPLLGDDVVFSGFPLQAPGMITHRGMVSGFDPAKEMIAVEASINKGNSGGALLNQQGKIVGIVSTREGGISIALDGLRKQNEQSGRNGSVRIMGMDPLASTNAIIDTLDTYISTGIGYARSIKFARDYLSRHPNMLK